MEPNALFSKDTPSIDVLELDDDSPYILIDISDSIKHLRQYDLVRIMLPGASTFYRGMVYEVYDTDICVQVERGNTYWL